MDIRRNNTAIREIEAPTELEFPSPSASPDISSEQPSTMQENLRLLWEKRRVLYRVLAWAIPISIIVVLLIPNQYESTARIMPPDPASNAGSMLAALTGKANPELMAMASSLLGVKG